MAATDSYDNDQTGLSSPAEDGFAITPHDTNELAKITRGIHVGGSAGTVVVVTKRGTTLTLYGALGATIPIRAKIVTTASTATGLVGLV